MEKKSLKNLSKETLKVLSEYTDELLKWNRVYSFTSLKDRDSIFKKLIIPSIAVEKFLKEGAVVLDFGSGVGIPGIPLKIVRPDLKIFLVERSKKKLAFLRFIRAKLGLSSVEIVEKDLRGNEEEFLERFDGVVSRASGNPPAVFEKLHSLLRKGGIFIGYSKKKGPFTHTVELPEDTLYLWIKRKL